MAYKLFTDSTTDLPKWLLAEFDITVVPLSVLFGEEEYFDLEPSVFYQMLAESETLPTTSQVPPERFLEAFRPVLAAGDKIICILLSSNASGTYQSARLAKDTLETEDIILIDSNSLCLGLGMIVYKTAKMLRAGASMEAIQEMVDFHTNNKIEHLFCVDTLKYLKKGGRIKASKAAIAEILNIKPILNVDNGLTQAFSKVRGRNKIIPAYIEHIKSNIDLEKTDVILIGHSEDPDMAKRLEEAVRKEISYEGEVVIGEIGSVIGAHTGPGVIAIFYVKK